MSIDALSHAARKELHKKLQSMNIKSLVQVGVVNDEHGIRLIVMLKDNKEISMVPGTFHDFLVTTKVVG